ncbi:hypothetical protein FHX34_10357 [Actinoplanes teichomyceticus]|uniref:Uncharacterized protein n=1 Tax=Actinoplanes teichomyceticus TaxID=1867 RepID=A0A561W9L5_ACTTI|nr:hypothetical protein FHX34_10357 [Actinoplanes teichomyceticus]
MCWPPSRTIARKPRQVLPPRSTVRSRTVIVRVSVAIVAAVTASRSGPTRPAAQSRRTVTSTACVAPPVHHGVVPEPEAPHVRAGRRGERRGGDHLAVRPGRGPLVRARLTRPITTRQRRSPADTGAQVCGQVVAHPAGVRRWHATGRREIAGGDAPRRASAAKISTTRSNPVPEPVPRAVSSTLLPAAPCASSRPPTITAGRQVAPHDRFDRAGARCRVSSSWARAFWSLFRAAGKASARRHALPVRLPRRRGGRRGDVLVVIGGPPSHRAAGRRRRCERPRGGRVRRSRTTSFVRKQIRIRTTTPYRVMWLFGNSAKDA